MMVFTNPPGKSEAFVDIVICVGDQEAEFAPTLLDAAGRQRLRNATQGQPHTAFEGTAQLKWRCEGARAACIADHEKSPSRRTRWARVQEYAERMRQGEFPPQGHVYVIDTSIENRPVTVIDGTRRMMAHLEAGMMEMRIIALVAQHR